MRIRVAMLAVCLRSLVAQSTLEQPQLGIMLDRAGTARPIYGVAGSVTYGDAVATEATAVACSKRACLVKSESALMKMSGGRSEVIDAPAGPALLALDGDEALVYFPQSRRLTRWRRGQLDPVDLPVPDAASNGGTIVSMRVGKVGIEFAVARDSGTWIVHSDGSIADFVSEGMGPVLLLQHGVLFATADGLVLRRSDGSEARFEVAGVNSLFEFGEGYVEARTAEAPYAIRTEPGREQMFVLPESQP